MAEIMQDIESISKESNVCVTQKRQSIAWHSFTCGGNGRSNGGKSRSADKRASGEDGERGDEIDDAPVFRLLLLEKLSPKTAGREVGGSGGSDVA